MSTAAANQREDLIHDGSAPLVVQCDQRSSAATVQTEQPRSAIAQCCLISARMLEIADDGQTRSAVTLSAIRSANSGQANQLRKVAEISDGLLAAAKNVSALVKQIGAPYTVTDSLRLSAALCDLQAAIAKAEGRQS